MPKGSEGQKKACSVCEGPGHNKKTCPWKAHDGEGAPRAAREAYEAKEKAQRQGSRSIAVSNAEDDPSRLALGGVNAFQIMSHSSEQQAGARRDAGAGAAPAVDGSERVHPADPEEGSALRIDSRVKHVVTALKDYERVYKTWIQDPVMGGDRSTLFEARDPVSGQLDPRHPEKNYDPNVIVWNPWFSDRKVCGEAPMCPACLSATPARKKQLSSKGYTWKRVLTLEMTVTVMVTKRFECQDCADAKKRSDGTTCKTKTFSGWDSTIIADLPSGIRDKFQYRNEHRALVDRALLDELMYLTDHGFTVESFAQMVRERGVAVYHKRELAYKQRLAALRENGAPPFHIERDKWPDIVDLLPYNSKDGYNLWTPQGGFWRRMMDKINEEKLPLREKAMSTLGGKVLKFDHVRKPAKVIKVLNQRVFKSFYNATNEYGQLTTIYFVETEAMSEIQDALKALNNRYVVHGHPRVEVIYVDNCCTVSPFFKQVFPSLNDGTVNPPLPFLKIEDFGMTYVYVSEASTANEICAGILERVKSDSSRGEVGRVGMDIEWTPPTLCVKIGDGLVSTIQIAHGSQVFVFHMPAPSVPNRKKVVPDILKSLLEDETILKSGINIQGDCTRLEKIGVRVPSQSLEDVGIIAAKVGVVPARPSLLVLTKAFFNRDMNKDSTLSMSYWDSQVLQDPQIQYAALDAAAVLAVAKCLDPIQVLAKDRLVAENEVTLMDTSDRKEVARGVLQVTPRRLGDLASVLEHVSVKVTTVLCPSVKLTVANRGGVTGSHGPRTLGEMREQAILNRPANSTADEEFEIQWCAFQLKARLRKSDIHAAIQQSGLSHVPSLAQLEMEPVTDAGHTAVWKRETVKVDAFHLMDRIGVTVSLHHSCRPDFERAFRDAMFAIDSTERAEWEVCEKQKLAKQGVTDDKQVKALLDKRYKLFLKSTQRAIPPPEELASSCQKVFEMYGYQLCKTKGDPLFKQSTWDAVENAKKHIEKGCVSDKPDGPALYYSSPDGKRLYVARGTNVNEGMHRHQAMVLRSSPTRSPVSAMGSMMSFATRWNINRGVDRCGDEDFASVDLETLLSLKEVDRQLELVEGKYRTMLDPNEYLGTGEKFCILNADINSSRIPQPEHGNHDDNHDDDDDDDDDDEDEGEGRPEGSKDIPYRMTEVERKFAERRGLPASCRLMLANHTTQDESELYKRLLPESLTNGSLDLRKMKGLWDEAVAKNNSEPASRQKKLGAASVLSLENLRDIMVQRDAIRQSRAELHPQAQHLSETLRGPRTGATFTSIPAAAPMPFRLQVPPTDANLLNASRVPLSFPFGAVPGRNPLLPVAPFDVQGGSSGSPGATQKQTRAGATCSRCGHPKWSQRWKEFHSSTAKAHLQSCHDGSCGKPGGCNPAFCTVPEAQKAEVPARRMHRKRRMESD
mmetsp:Transcript_32691/g.83673  ORF Transcript_32691/g.83673 Transcript_32691/m.83673 type:complete len:1417 (-) Transcript_32691:210-4460(-)